MLFPRIFFVGVIILRFCGLKKIAVTCHGMKYLIVKMDRSTPCLYVLNAKNIGALTLYLIAFVGKGRSAKLKFNKIP
jgi:hypothetical protein